MDRGKSQLKRTGIKRGDSQLKRSEFKQKPSPKRQPRPRMKRSKRAVEADRQDRSEFDVGKTAARKRDGNRCRVDLLPAEAGVCEFDVHVHHRQPAGFGRRRNHHVNNLLCLCLSHHDWVHSHPDDPTVCQFGLLISTHDSGEIPPPGIVAWDENGFRLDGESS